MLEEKRNVAQRGVPGMVGGGWVDLSTFLSDTHGLILFLPHGPSPRSWVVQLYLGVIMAEHAVGPMHSEECLGSVLQEVMARRRR